MSSEIRSILAQEAAAIQSINCLQEIEQAVEAIYAQVHLKKAKLVISGMGKAGQMGQTIASTFCSTGTPAIFLHPSEAQHGDLGVLQENDLLFLLSNSGKTREILELVRLSEALYPDLRRIVMTGNQDAPLAKTGGIILFTGGPKEICPLGLTPTTSTTVMAVIGDILTVLLMKKIGFTAEAYAKRHHSGYLNHKARKQFL